MPIEKIGLDGDVQAAGGFVGNQQPGMGAQCDGDQHTLRHAAADFVRERVKTPIGVVDADAAQHFQGIRPARTCGD